MINRRLKELRIEKGATQRDFAKAIGVSQSVISNWEKGLNVPSILFLSEISQYFDVSVEYLLGITDECGNATGVSLDDLPPDEQQLLMLYRKVDLHDKEKILTALEVLASTKVK